MKENSKGCLGQIAIGAIVMVLIVAWYYGREYFGSKSVQGEEIVLKITAYDFAEQVNKDPKSFDKYLNQYAELEGVILNIVYSGGATIYFTSGRQTDSSYQVGQPLLLDQLLKSDSLSKCDSLIMNYGNSFRMNEAPLKILFKGRLINSGDTLATFNYFDKCTRSNNKRPEFYLENFCLNKIVVKAKLDAINATENGIEVELDDVLIISKAFNKKTEF